MIEAPISLQSLKKLYSKIRAVSNKVSQPSMINIQDLLIVNHHSPWRCHLRSTKACKTTTQHQLHDGILCVDMLRRDMYRLSDKLSEGSSYCHSSFRSDLRPQVLMSQLAGFT